MVAAFEADHTLPDWYVYWITEYRSVLKLSQFATTPSYSAHLNNLFSRAKNLATLALIAICLMLDLWSNVTMEPRSLFGSGNR